MIGLAVLGAAIGLAGIFVVAEYVARARLQRRGEYFVWAPYARIRMELDREALPDLEPVVTQEFNQDGERGDLVPEKWDHCYRVLVAGGSVAECYFLDQKSAWPYVIQRILNEPRNLEKLGVTRAHVGNIARSLVACNHVCLMLERVLPRYPRLDVLVYMVGASDLVHWLEQGAPNVLLDEPIPAEQVFAVHPEPPFGWTPKTLALRRIASYWNKRLRRPIALRTEAGKRLAQARLMRARAQAILNEVPDPKPMLDQFERYFRELLKIGKKKAKRVIVVRQPWFEKDFTPAEEQRLWNFGAGRPYGEEVTHYYSHQVVWNLMRQIDARASAIAAEMGAEQVELMSVLERSFDIYYDELHHTPKGCEVVGRTVAEKILRAGAS